MPGIILAMADTKFKLVEIPDDVLAETSRLAAELGESQESHIIAYEALLAYQKQLRKRKFAEDVRRLAEDPQIKAEIENIEKYCSDSLSDGLELKLDTPWPDLLRKT